MIELCAIPPVRLASHSVNAFATGMNVGFGRSGSCSVCSRTPPSGPRRARSAIALVIPAHTLKGDSAQFGATPLSILAEPPVAIVDSVADKKGTRAAAEAYLKYWYTPQGQEIAARNFYRPRDAAVGEKYADAFAKVELFTIDDVFGGWTKAQKEHFAEGGMFDKIYKN